MKKESKVILFPLKNKLFEPSEPLTLEQRILELVLFEFSTRNYDINYISEHQYKDLALLVEAVNSIISRYNLEGHFLHNLADNIYKINDEGRLEADKTYVIKEINDIT